MINIFIPQPTNRLRRVRSIFLRYTAGVLGVFTMLALISTLSTPSSSSLVILAEVILLIICGISIWLASIHRPFAGGFLLSFWLVICIAVTVDQASTNMDSAQQAAVMAAYVLPIMIAGMIAGGLAAFSMSGIAVLAIIFNNTVLADGFTRSTTTTLLIISVLGSLSWFLFRNLDRLITEITSSENSALAAQHLAEQQTSALQTKTSELEESFERQQALLETIRVLQTPAIHIEAGVLLVPLVGHLDTHRIGDVTSSVLDELQRSSAKWLIIDITGISIVDTDVVQKLVNLAQSARLMGVTVILTGIKPAFARTLVDLGVKLENMLSFGNLEAGLKYIRSVFREEHPRGTRHTVMAGS